MIEENDYLGKKCDYFNQFVKFAISDLKNNGICYAYHKDQANEIKKHYKEELYIQKTDFGYTISTAKYRKVVK